MKRRITLSIALATISLYMFCSQGLCVSYPQRIISLGPSITEQLYLLGVQDRVIGCTIYCKRPEDARSKEKIGTVTEVNSERIVNLKPDLVIATSLTNPKAVKKMEKLGIKVTKFSSPENFSGLCKQYLELARIVGRESSAEALIHRVKDKVSAARKKVENLSKPRVFIQVGAKPLITATKKSFINDFIEFAGGINIASSATTGLYSREEVLRKNPDIIFIVTMGISGEKEMEIWRRYGVIEAVKNNRIYIIDSDKVCSPTPLSFVQTLEEFVYILHSESIQAEKR